LNYTVFGREVNLASRLESVSGRSRIIISEATYSHLLRDDPELAATCIALPSEKLKGFTAMVKIYEVPWRLPGSLPIDDDEFSAKSGEGTSFTGLVQRDKP
jgi:class 3 adenylate cyclase